MCSRIDMTMYLWYFTPHGTLNPPALCQFMTCCHPGIRCTGIPFQYRMHLFSILPWSGTSCALQSWMTTNHDLTWFQTKLAIEGPMSFDLPLTHCLSSSQNLQLSNVKFTIDFCKVKGNVWTMAILAFNLFMYYIVPQVCHCAHARTENEIHFL